MEKPLHRKNDHVESIDQELLGATRLKEDFLATMSHELRTPLNAILGSAEALQEELFGPLNERQLKSLRMIRRGGQRLLSLVNDILDISRIEAGKLTLDIVPTSVLALCSSSLAAIKEVALNKQIQLDIQVAPAIGKIAVDERRMGQVLNNLLSNAVKFTPQGGRVRLLVDRQEGDKQVADSSWIDFTVADTGIGIASVDRDKLFQPFVQLDSSLNRQYAGTGLGLTLIKQIVELHGGKIILESELGQGSCFTVRLPHTCLLTNLDSYPIDPFDSLSSYSGTIDQETAGSALILLAADNEAHINTFSNYLTAKGYRTVLAKNDREVVSILEGCTNDLVKQDLPDLILLDMQMTKMDGIAAISLIRQKSQLVKVPIIVLAVPTIEGNMLKERDRCLAAGANDYLAKPIQLKQLNLKVRQWLGWSSGNDLNYCSNQSTAKK